MSKVKLVDLDIESLDLRAYVGGRNPYGEADSSLARAFARGIPWYRDTVQHRIGISGKARVLDLLCGFGRWSIFLAECNEEVCALDTNADCIAIGRGMARDLGLDNLSFDQGDVSRISGYADASFDAVWIWSGLQYVHRGRVLSEVLRLLKPGGRLFVGNYNAPGLMLDHVMKAIAANKPYDGAANWALGALVRGEWANACPNYLSWQNAPRLLEGFGFASVVAGPEGTLDMRLPDGRNGEAGILTDGKLVRTTEFVAVKPTDVSDRRGRFRSMLKGSPEEQQFATAMLREDGIASSDDIASWLGDQDVLIQQNARNILVSRGAASVEALIKKLTGDNASASNNAAVALRELGDSAVAAVLRARASHPHPLLDSMLTELLGTGGLGLSARKARRLISSIARRIRSRLRPQG